MSDCPRLRPYYRSKKCAFTSQGRGRWTAQRWDIFSGMWRSLDCDALPRGLKNIDDLDGISADVDKIRF